jgi:hypothetical protein
MRSGPFRVEPANASTHSDGGAEGYAAVIRG